MSKIQSFKETKLVIVLNGFISYGGANKSIFNYYRYKINKGEKIELVDIQTFKGFLKFILAILFSPQILVNGLAAMWTWPVLIACLFRKGIIFYCHEAEHAFVAFKKRAPARYNLLAKVFPGLRLACVSKWQSDYLCSVFHVNQNALLYEAVDYDQPYELDRTRKNILMLGYIMPRKGVELFSKVADLAAERFPDLCFSWIGSGDPSGLYCSPRVQWLGEMQKPDVLLRQCDLLFLSSMDDPFPLACLEALSLKRRCVVYKNTGTAEVIRGVSGCAVFDEYTPESAYQAICNALHADLDMSRLEQIRQVISFVPSFATRLDCLLK
jgi:glycosyltransferase involved in cell wall biosynthesis